MQEQPVAHRTRPFAPARGTAGLGYPAARGPSEPGLWRVGDCVVDLREQLVRRGEQLVALRPMAWTLLAALLQRANALCSGSHLAATCWPGQAARAKMLGSLVSELRTALSGPQQLHNPIVCVPRRGYVLSARPETTAEPPAARGGTATTEPGAADEAGRSGELIGRTGELRVLLTTVNEAARPRCRATLITGEPGIGKSALLRECLRRLPPSGWTVLRATGRRPIGVVEPFGTWTAMLRHRAALGLPGPPQDIAQAVAPAWVDALPAVFGTPARRAPARDEADMRRQGVELFEAWSHRTPLLVVIDDLHWVDEASHALLVSLLASGLAGRIECWLSTRGDADADREPDILGCAPGVISLQPLDEREVTRFLALRLGDAQAAREVASRAHASTGGSPLWLDLLAGLLADPSPRSDWPGLLDRAAQSGLAGLLRHRLELLDPDGRAVIDALAAMAGAAPARLLATALGMSWTRMLAACHRLVERRLVREHPAQETMDPGDLGPVVGMIHTLHAELVWRDMAPARRIALSRQLSAAVDSTRLIERQPTWRAQAALVLAHANRHLEAARILRGQHAASQNHFSATGSRTALLAVLEQLKQAGDSPDAMALRIEVVHDLFELSTLHNGSAGPAALLHLDELKAMARIAPSPRTDFLVAHAACTAAIRSGRADLAHKEWPRLQQAAGHLGPAERASALLLEGSLLRVLGDIEEASRPLLELLDAPAPANDERLQSLRAHASIAHHWNLCIRGEPESGLPGLAASVQRSLAAGKPYLALAARFWTGSALRQLGCRSAARRELQEVHRNAASLRSHFLRDECLAGLQACLPPRERDGALLERLSQPNESTVPIWGNRIAARLLAEALIEWGDITGAEAIAEATHDDLTRMPLYTPEVHRLDGDIAWARGHHDQAVRCWITALREARAQGNQASAIQVVMRCMARGIAADVLGSGTVQQALSGLLRSRRPSPQLLELGDTIETVRTWLRAAPG